VAIADTNDDEDEEGPIRFDLRAADGRRTSVTASDLQFTSDDTVLTVDRTNTAALMAERSVSDPVHIDWQLSVPTPVAGPLRLDVRTRAWEIPALSPRDSIVERYSGIVGDPRIEVRRWLVPRGAAYYWLIGSGKEPIGIERDYRSYRYALNTWLMPLDAAWHAPLTLHFRLGSPREMRSQFAGDCNDGPPGTPVVCIIRDGTRSHLWAWNGSILESRGQLRGDVMPVARDAYGWTFGVDRARLLAIDPSANRAFDFGALCRDGCMDTYTFTGTAFGAVARRRQGAVVEVYEKAATVHASVGR
jgi:hypothetical protein